MALPAPTNIQAALITFLKTRIEVKDDGAAVITGLVSGGWYEGALFKDGTYEYQVTVFTETQPTAKISDIGGFYKEYNALFFIDVWVHEKRDVNYTAERIRHELIHQVDSILWQIEMSRTQAFQMDTTEWLPLDEPENKLLRSRLTIYVYYQKYRGSAIISP